MPIGTFGEDLYRIWYNVGFHHDKSQVRVRLSIYRDREFDRRLYAKLYELRYDAERALGQELGWERVTARKASMITAFAPGSLDSSENDRGSAKRWLVATVAKFNDVFPLI